MTGADSPELTRFLAAPDHSARELAWERLVSAYSPLFLKVANTLGGGHDAVMDRYAYLLERLREDDFRRLRAFRPDGPARFSTWLVVTTRRLCVDHHRTRFGRAPAGAPADEGLRQIRRRLALDHNEVVDLAAIPDNAAIPPDEAMDGRARDRVMHDLLAGLPSRDQLLLKLRYHDGLPATDIARVMRFPTPFHAYRRVQALLATLKLLIAQDPLFRRDG